MFDISSLAVAETTVIHVKNAKGEPMYADADRTLPVQIEVYGPGSKPAAIVDSRQTSRALKRMADNDGKVTAATPEERLAETAEDLTTVTKRFINFSYHSLEGAELFEAVYADPSLGFIARQVDKARSDWGNCKAASDSN